MDHEQQEIIRHALIGGLVAVALASFHEIAEGVAKELLRGHTALIVVIEWSALFVVVFTAIVLIEFYLRRRQWRAKIWLDQVGYVDGRWIDIVATEGTVKAVAVLEISSAAGEGFRISGVTYDVAPGGVDRSSKGAFQSTQGTSFGKNGIAYIFEGFTPAGKEHFGVGYYRFLRETNGSVRTEGSYLARQENNAFHTLGVRLNEGTPNALTEDEVLAIMNDLVKRRSQTSMPIACGTAPGAG